MFRVFMFSVMSKDPVAQTTPVWTTAKGTQHLPREYHIPGSFGAGMSFNRVVLMKA